MSQRQKLSSIEPDILWREWQSDIERIVRDGYELFALRRQFREMAEMFRENPILRDAGGHVLSWLRTCYGAAVIMRLRREVDTQPNTVNLRTLLEEIEKRPEVATRNRVVNAHSGHVEDFVLRMMNEQFSETWVAPPASGLPTDTVDPSLVREDRLSLELAAVELETLANRTLAHRPRAGSDVTTLTGADAIFDLVEELLKKYLALLTGTSLLCVEPTAQFDTVAPLTFPWHPVAYAKWANERNRNAEKE
jgi:hypothetical protein